MLTDWGRYNIIGKGPRYVVTEVHINAGNVTPLHYHTNEYEYWTVVGGVGKLKLNDTILNIFIPITISIRPYQHHQVKADTDLTIINIQMSSNLMDDDIVLIQSTW